MRITTVAATLAALLSTGSAQAREVSPALALDRLSLKMRGLPASREDKAELARGARKLHDFADAWKKDARFAVRLAEFWTRVLQIEAPTPIWSTDPADLPTLGETLKRNASGSTKGVFNNRSRPWEGDGCRRQLWRFENEGCACSEMMEISNAWFAPATKVWVCPRELSPDRCGPGLLGCFPMDNRLVNNLRENPPFPANRAADNIVRDFTLEPGMIVARTIIEDQPFSNALTTTKGLVTGSVAFMLKSWGEAIRSAAPPGTYAPERIIAALGGKAPDPNDRTYHWFERGPLNAGVITTPGLQRASNGQRVKFDVLRQAFLCQEFLVPTEPQLQSDEPDLTKKPYCRFCHATLEPGTQFLANWPGPGDNNYLFDPTPESAPTGTFEGRNGSGAPGLGAAFAASASLPRCAAERAFQFFVGRRPDESEAPLVKTLVDVYNGNKGQVWPVMRAIVASSAFVGN